MNWPEAQNIFQKLIKSIAAKGTGNEESRCDTIFAKLSWWSKSSCVEKVLA